MEYNALDISKYILNKCYKDKEYISNLQLQKILYFIQVEWLKKYNDVLFTDDIEAWHYGPVVESVYYEYSGYGGMKIKENYSDFELSPNLEKEKLELIDNLTTNYREKPPWELVEKSHKEDGSWYKVYKNYGHRSKIDISLIRELDVSNG